MTRAELLKTYPWLGITNTLEEYIEPDYYDRLLKPYVFDEKLDLEHFREYASALPAHSKLLEFGAGTGRVAAVALGAAPDARLTLVDQSARMLDRCKQKFAGKSGIEYVNADTVDFLLETEEKYDLAYSLFAFSHSVHQTLKRFGFAEGTKKVRRGIRKLLTENLERGGSFFLFHFDTLSQEQRISIRQRKRDNFVFAESEVQSPSKRIIDDLLKELRGEGAIEYSCRQYDGAPLEFASLDEALEYYLNFHMETHFNLSPEIGDVVAELLEDLKKCMQADGSIRIIPGCFVYIVHKK